MELTTNRLLYLIYLNHAEESNCTVTKMAKMFGVSKSTVSRNMDYFVEQGVVFSETMQLTAYGHKLADQYAKEVEALENWIRATVTGDDNEIHENALNMVVHLSENMKKQLLERIRMSKMFKSLEFKESIAFSEIAQELEDGSYPVSFIIYREQFQNGRYISMADKGFSHPAMLKVTGSTGIIQLRAVTMEQRNMLDVLIMRGKLLNLDYYSKGSFFPVAKDGDIYQIPADVFEYNFHKGENLLMGNVTIQIYAPLANKQLHTRKAVLSLFMQPL